MALFFPDDPSYDESVRLKGFDRYRQVLSSSAKNWFVVNLFTVIGAVPLAAGITIAVLSSSLLLLIPLSLVGGLILGPFLAGMFDSIMRGLRNEPGQWLRIWKKSWKQNAKDSLLPGALTGLVIGLYVFMGFVMWWSVTGPTLVTIVLYPISALVFFTVTLLFWPQLVLFSQPPRQTLINIILFSAKYLWRVLGAAAVVLLYTAIMVLFAPLSLLLVPVLGCWYILFLAEFIFYEQLNEEFRIEETLDRQRDLEAGRDPDAEAEG